MGDEDLRARVQEVIDELERRERDAESLAARHDSNDWNSYHTGRNEAYGCAASLLRRMLAGQNFKKRGK